MTGASKQTDYDQMMADYYNQEEGTMTGHDCRMCKNKGYIMVIVDGYQALRPCECMKVRKSMSIIKNSGLSNLLEEYSFDKFIAIAPWQQFMKESAQRFIDDPVGNWFFAGGQVGSGKSHICTAIVSEMMKRGSEALYMRWRDDSVSLKRSIASDGKEYTEEIERYKRVKVLYIDDFFKTERGKPPTAADINLAFELLNHRYINKELVTIISSERFIDDLLSIDEAIGSRIYQRSRKYCIEITNDKSKNIRLKEGKRT